MRLNSKLLLAHIILICGISSCTVLDQAKQAGNLSKCEFRLESVQQLNLAGINVQNVEQLSDLSMSDAGKLLSFYSAEKFPLKFTLYIEAKNPNATPAGLSKLDWRLLIDGVEMTQGILDKSFSIPANNATAIIPLQVNIDLKEALSGKSADAVINFALNLAGFGNKPTRITMKLKPTISINGFPIAYPGYINVNTEFSSK